MKFKLNWKLTLSLVTLFVLVFLLLRLSSLTYNILDKKSNYNINDNCVYVLSASFCGHCKKLKESGELESLNKKIPVVVVPHTHEDCQKLMKQVKGNGYPTIVVAKNRRLYKFEGERKADQIVNYYESI